MNRKKGLLIVIEGVDSSGKETQAKLLKEKLEKQGLSVMLFSFPRYKTPACVPVELYLSGYFGDNANEVNPYLASTMYAIDRYASLKRDNWKEFYDNGGIIIFDRYVLSNVIHQGAKMSKPERKEFIEWLYDLEYNKAGLPIPDKILFLDMLPELSQLLIKDRANKITGEQKKDIHEKDPEYLKHCYETSMNIAVEQGWDVVPCYHEKNITDLSNIKKEFEINDVIFSKVKELI